MTGASFVLAQRVSPADVSRRVSLRYVDPADGRATDVVGVLSSWSDGRLVVTRRDGRTADVPASALLAGKVVPPDVGAYDVQELADSGWPAQDRETVGAWVARWDHGVTRRANSALVSGPVGDLPGQLAALTRWYGARGAPAILQLPDPWSGDDELDSLGWVRDGPTYVLTVSTQELRSRLPAGEVRVDVSTSAAPAWLALVDRFSVAEQETLGRILTRPPVVAFASAYVDATLVGIGRASLDTRAGLRWACLTNLNTIPSARRRGVARALTAALARWADDRGATTTYLQVEEDNAVARRLYESLGFAVHHRYAYRRVPAA